MSWGITSLITASVGIFDKSFMTTFLVFDFSKLSAEIGFAAQKVILPYFRGLILVKNAIFATLIVLLKQNSRIN